MGLTIIMAYLHKVPVRRQVHIFQICSPFKVSRARFQENMYVPPQRPIRWSEYRLWVLETWTSALESKLGRDDTSWSQTWEYNVLMIQGTGIKSEENGMEWPEGNTLSCQHFAPSRQGIIWKATSYQGYNDERQILPYFFMHCILIFHIKRI